LQQIYDIDTSFWTRDEGVIPTGVFRTGDLEQMRMGVIEHLGKAQAPAWLFAAELREGAVVRLLTPLECTVPILAVRPASGRMSAKVRVFRRALGENFRALSSVQSTGLLALLLDV
jgi:DNA-binding transcriptional LysR family regulator